MVRFLRRGAGVNARRLSPPQLADALSAARAATLAATVDLDDRAWVPAYDPGLQPTAWDLAHIGWFAEFWLLRGPHRIGPDGNARADRPPRWFGPDEQLDSARIAHRARWQMPLLPRAELLARLQDQLAACRQALAAGPDDDRLYHAHFALFHELMHTEALAWTRAIQALPAPPGLVMPSVGALPELWIDGGEHRLGGGGDGEFAFDNELPGRTVRLEPFAIDAVPVVNARFAAFVDAGGYERDELWPGAAGAWRERRAARLPQRWRRTGTGFEQRWFDRWQPLVPDAPVVHMSAFEAEAFCRWAGRRLPSAAEWEVAAPRLSWGDTVWEWTADPFAPYAGFRPGPYTTYSAPWFHHQRELRGGCFATHRLMHDHRYRNFFLPGRTDVFAGFRTVAAD
ncbi:MAG: SUMF1/EgtB/PvdO family nonheme iron enzyme [Planctomycetes bacterium]|nr:SUMF1/EgtB/PvdO family nonheme iron enzyme [Planctomycetota bacterium]